MPTFEEEYRRIEKFVDFITKFFLLPKKIEVRGRENFVLDGPNIIVGNHVGSYQDVSVLVRIRPRLTYFTANKEIFTRQEASDLVLRHLHTHMGKFGGVVHFIFNPFYSFMVAFVSRHIARIGSIPVDLRGSKRASVLRCQDYLRKGRAIVALQGRGRIQPKDPNPYVAGFRRGVSIMAYNLYKESELSVPVTPLSIFGTHIMWGVPATVKVNVGKPLYIKDHWTGDEVSTIERFRSTLERTVSGLLLESLGW